MTHVYKIEVPPEVANAVVESEKMEAELSKIKSAVHSYSTETVSYTHLTLPTILLV